MQSFKKNKLINKYKTLEEISSMQFSGYQPCRPFLFKYLIMAHLQHFLTVKTVKVGLCIQAIFFTADDEIYLTIDMSTTANSPSSLLDI